MYFITSNQGKLKEVQTLLPTVKALALDLPEIQSLDSKEIIQHKLETAIVHAPPGKLIVEDTALSIAALQGLPGPLVRWFLTAMQADGLSELALKYDPSPRATARTTIGYYHSPTNLHFFTGEISGTIVSPRGKNGFGWDTIFQPDGYQTTFAEMNTTEKNQVSMRKIAIEKLKATLHETK